MLNVYITNLAMYNEGTLYGKWVSLPMNEDELKEEIKSILRPGDEEYFITDYESELGIEAHEYENIFSLNEQLEELQEVMEEYYIPEKVIAALMEEFLRDIEQVINCIRGDRVHWIEDVSSLSDVGYAMVQDGLYGDIPECIKEFIDYEAIGESWRANGGVLYREYEIGLEIY